MQTFFIILGILLLITFSLFLFSRNTVDEKEEVPAVPKK